MHSTVIGGSSAERIIKCPATRELSKNIPPQPSSVYAQEGTALHAVMEKALLAFTTPSETVIGAEVEGVTITKELYYEKALPAWDMTIELFKHLDVDEFEAEGQVQFTPVPEAFGTCDIVARTKTGDLVIADYKFGDGHMVDPEDNPQLMFYAAAASHDPAFKDWVGSLDQKVHLAVIQPAQGELKVWSTTLREVAAFSATIVMAVDRTGEPNPGTWCKWCPAAPICPAMQSKAGAAAALMGKEDLTTLATSLAFATQLEPWIRKVKTLAHKQLEGGANIDGFKLVPKRATRQWVDESDTLATLKRSRTFKHDEYTVEKMVSPPQFEKLCKQKEVDFAKFADMISKVSSGTTLAPVSDPREAVVVSANREIPKHLADQM